MTQAVSLHQLAQAAGLSPLWVDATGKPQQVSDRALVALLEALGHCATTPTQRQQSAAFLTEQAQQIPALITADAGGRIELPAALKGGAFSLRDEEGASLPLREDAAGFIAPDAAGYYTLTFPAGEVTLAVAPPRCFGVADALDESAPREWGLAAQVYSLSRRGDGGVGDSGSVVALGEQSAAAGASALGLSPLHAIAPITERYSPYSPSHRGFLNPWLADPALVLGEAAVTAALVRTGLSDRWDEQEHASLIDWPVAADLRQQLWRALFDDFEQARPALRQDFEAFCRDGGQALDDHAVLAARQELARSNGESLSWRHWGDQWRSTSSSARDAFSSVHRDDVAFERFRQWLASRSWRNAQTRLRESGMAIGLIADLAVGFDPGGGEAWSYRDALLDGLALGAPPDALSAHGQQWGITSYSPAGLTRTGYAPFLQTLRANMRIGGGLRLDHILGLSRLWVVPADAPASEGAYLAYPLQDLLRLVALESWRHRCIVIGEDLGTVPPQLRELLAQRGVMGTDVLLFCRDDAGCFTPSNQWRRDAMATTTTHDLPPLLGWRRGLDLATQANLHQWPDTQLDQAMTERQNDVEKLDQALSSAPAALEKPTAPDLAAMRFVARSAASLVLIPMEDALGRIEQPNLPGTVDEHPNWRQRLPLVDAHESIPSTMRSLAQARSHVPPMSGHRHD